MKLWCQRARSSSCLALPTFDPSPIRFLKNKELMDDVLGKRNATNTICTICIPPNYWKPHFNLRETKCLAWKITLHPISHIWSFYHHPFICPSIPLMPTPHHHRLTLPLAGSCLICPVHLLICESHNHRTEHRRSHPHGGQSNEALRTFLITNFYANPQHGDSFLCVWAQLWGVY